MRYRRPPIRAYADTTVFGGIVDVEFEVASRAAGILAAKSATDALHIAIASVSKCELIVSWNFRHIVRESKIKRFNEVNIANGYDSVAIHSPLEVIHENEKKV